MSRPYSPRLAGGRHAEMSFCERLGRELLLKGDRAAAKRAFEVAMGAEPDNAHLVVALGDVYCRAECFEEAQQYYQAALSIDSFLAGAHNGMGCALVESVDAEPFFRRAVELAPESATYHANLAASMIEQGRSDEAVEHFMEAICLDDSVIEYSVALASILADDQHFAEAEFYLQRALLPERKAVPVDGPAWAMYNMREFDRADPLFARVTEPSATKAEAFRMLAAIQLDCGKAVRAVRSLRRAVTLNPQAAHLHFELADAYIAAGKGMLAATSHRRGVGLEKGERALRADLSDWAAEVFKNRWRRQRSSAGRRA